MFYGVKPETHEIYISLNEGSENISIENITRKENNIKKRKL